MSELQIGCAFTALIVLGAAVAFVVAFYDDDLVICRRYHDWHGWLRLFGARRCPCGPAYCWAEHREEAEDE
jgi:hypothetical protein